MTMVCIDVGTTDPGTLQVFQVFSDLPPFLAFLRFRHDMMTPSLGSKRCNAICIRIRP
jgi:hypothetical protein